MRVQLTRFPDFIVPATMIPNISVTTAFLTGLITFSLLYGVYFVLFLGSLYVLVYKKRSGQLNYIILGGTVLQFVLITVCYGIRWARIYAAFITNGDKPQGPLLFFAQLNDWRELSSTALWAITSALGDIMFIYRLYIVWDSRIVPCLAPLALLIGSLTSTVGLLVVLNQPLTTAYTTQLTHWVWAFLSFNLAQNLLVTLLIIARIWSVNVRSAKFTSGTGLWSVIVVLLESGALYSSSVLIFLVTYVCQNNAAMIMTDMVMPIMGITFNLIIVRIGLGLSKGDTTLHNTTRGKNSTIQFVQSSSTCQPYPLQDFADTTSHVDHKVATVSSSYEYA